MREARLFEAWYKVRDGTIRRSTFRQTVAWLRPMVRSSLEDGAACEGSEQHRTVDGPKNSLSCTGNEIRSIRPVE